MVRKYEVGDVVEVIGPDNDFKHRTYGLTWVKEMDVYIGRTMTVCEIIHFGDYENYRIEPGSYRFAAAWLKPSVVKPGVNDVPKCESVELW